MQCLCAVLCCVDVHASLVTSLSILLEDSITYKYFLQRNCAWKSYRKVILCGAQIIYFFTFFFFFYKLLYCPNGISSMGSSGCSPRGKLSRYPNYDTCLVFWCLHNPPNSDMNYRIFNVHIDVNACDCTRGCTDTVRESALKADYGRKIPCRTGESNLRQRRTGPMLYQLSCIPTPLRSNYYPGIPRWMPGPLDVNKTVC